MYKRELAQTIIQDLNENPAVAIVGPRQIGKTTLALEIAKQRTSIRLDLENPEDLRRLVDPIPFLESHKDKLVIIDEVQKYPDLFEPLRVVIDKGIEEGNVNGRFLILGSASNKLLKQSSDGLPGRISYLELSGLNPFEIEEPQGKSLLTLFQRGGFPKSYIAANDKASYNWRKNFINTLINRDIKNLGIRIPSATLGRLWTMLANLQGQELNATNLASPLGVSGNTIQNYILILEDLLLVRKLFPWCGNSNKRLVKSPRVYVRDSGIVHAQLRIKDYHQLLGHRIKGKSWEGFVIENIISNSLDVQHYFYSTFSGAEIDLVIEFDEDDYWAVEIKSNRAPKLKRGFYQACEDLKVKNKYVVYAGEELFSYSDGTTFLSLSQFIEILRKKID